MPALQRYWQARFATWPAPARATPPKPLVDGFTVLVPVPGDLPVFLDLALAVCRAQDSPHRVETLVVPDVMTDQVADIMARERSIWPGKLNLLSLPLPERWVLPRLGDPGRNHAIQLNTAIARTHSSHVIMHDADLFLLEPDLHERQWEFAVENDLDVLGVDPVWDGWFADHGRHLASTWEMIARTEWLRSFPPWRHIAHRALIDGELHVFDTTLWAQCETPPERIAIHPLGGIVHFNYVISTYRKFRKSPHEFHDNRFRLLLIRVLIDLFDTSGTAYGLPTVTELAEGLGRADATVTYSADDAEVYREFRPKLGEIITGFPPPAGTSLDTALAAFDTFYA